MNQAGVLDHAASLGRELRFDGAEGRVRELARVVANERRASVTWSERDGKVVGTVTADATVRVLAAPLPVERRPNWQAPTCRAAQAMVLQSLTVSLVHEATRCTCTPAQPRCPAFMAFSREADR